MEVLGRKHHPSPRPKHRPGYRKHPLCPQHIRHQRFPPEQPLIRPVEHIQRAGVGAEGGHDQAGAVAGEAAAADGAAALDDAGAGVEVASDLAFDALL